MSANRWIVHVKEFASKHNMKYGEALKHPTCKATYRYYSQFLIKGGGLEEVDLRQILITLPIINAVNARNPDVDFSQFKVSREAAGFALPRMEDMMNSNFERLLEKEPVDLTVAKNSDGKMLGTKIGDTMKKLYEILNGRHRISRAIIEGRQTIKANII
jgi:hypothetical protein